MMTPTTIAMRARRAVEEWREAFDPDHLLPVARTAALVAEAMSRSPVSDVSPSQVDAICRAALERARQLEADRIGYLARQRDWIRAVGAARAEPVQWIDESKLPTAPDNGRFLAGIGVEVEEDERGRRGGRQERERRLARAGLPHPHHGETRR